MGSQFWGERCWLILLVGSIGFAQSASDLKLTTGKEIFQAACAGCHGPDGKGQPQSTLGFDPPASFPDFTDCPSATPEPDSHWSAMIHEGGRVRAFSQIMPSFREALTDEEIRKVVAYLRSFCEDRRWPIGNLNLPRPLVTEKAYPENENVLTGAVNANQTPAVTSELIFEKRIGARHNVEAVIPGVFQKQPSGSWFGSVGDIALAWKTAAVHSARTGSILSVLGEVRLPTGNVAQGLGAGVTFVEGSLAFAQILPRNSFVQMHAGVGTPTRRHQEPSEAFWRTAVGKSFNQGGWGRLWTPMVEMVSARELVSHARVDWDVVPEMQVTLSKRQHIRANVGVSIPATNTAGRAAQVMFYVLWDWFDGGIREGWR